MNKAWCPQGQVDENPIMEYFKYIIFEKYDKIDIKRPEKFGGDLNIGSYDELTEMFSSGKVHPMDLKNTAGNYINELIDPIREKLLNDPKIKEMREKIQTFKVTR